MKMTNAWNRIVYRLWAPVYDATISRLYNSGRRRAIELLAPQPGERILIVGVGTGADLPLLPAGVAAVGIDLSPAMLAKARKKLLPCRAAVWLVQGDAQSVLVAEQSFDAAILNLILSVVPDGQACLQSALWALKPGGRAVIFDKFQPDSERLSLRRRVLNAFSTLVGTDITRRLGDIKQNCLCTVTLDDPGMLGATYRIILLQKTLDAESLPGQARATPANGGDGPSNTVVESAVSVAGALPGGAGAAPDGQSPTLPPMQDPGP